MLQQLRKWGGARGKLIGAYRIPGLILDHLSRRRAVLHRVFGQKQWKSLVLWSKSVLWTYGKIENQTISARYHEASSTNPTRVLRRHESHPSQSGLVLLHGDHDERRRMGMGIWGLVSVG